MPFNSETKNTGMSGTDSQKRWVLGERTSQSAWCEGGKKPKGLYWNGQGGGKNRRTKLIREAGQGGQSKSGANQRRIEGSYQKEGGEAEADFASKERSHCAKRRGRRRAWDLQPRDAKGVGVKGSEIVKQKGNARKEKSLKGT